MPIMCSAIADYMQITHALSYADICPVAHLINCQILLSQVYCSIQKIFLFLSSNPVCLCSNGHFPGEPGLTRVY